VRNRCTGPGQDLRRRREKSACSKTCRASMPLIATEFMRHDESSRSATSAVNLKFLSLLAASSLRNFKFKTALES
jgi:hypothetical protein